LAADLPPAETVFDTLIVGAGTAGCVLAERLSADPRRRVLLLEAGPPDTHPFIHMPRGVAKVLSDPAHVWPFQAIAGAGSNAPAAYWVRGRTLGGSSSTNGMMYVRSQPADVEALAEAAGEQWGWRHMAPIYAAAESHPLGAGDARGDTGPLHVSLPPHHPLLDRFIAAGAATGLEVQDDVNRPDDRAKIGYCPSTIFKGRRQSAARAFLRPARWRGNLTVITDASVETIRFDGRRATGVNVVVNGERRAFAARRVILAGGTLASPALLQRSGIGPAALLDHLGIPVIADRAEVGENLKEHCALAMQWRVRSGLSTNAEFGGWRLIRNVLRYYLARSGPMASAAYDVLGHIRTRADLPRPDAQLIAAPFSIDKSASTLKMEKAPGMQVAVYPLRPQSTGSVRVTTPDPGVLPLSTLDFFADAEDRRTMIGAVRYVRDLVSRAPLADAIVAEVRPGTAADDEDAILDVWRAMGTTAYHAAGTCRMGRDAASVVDPETRVRGVDGLHVVDLSIFPDIPAGNTFAPVMALAWRAADLIAASER
jgi:choline dehydrogenase-like flavoprotein